MTSSFNQGSTHPAPPKSDSVIDSVSADFAREVLWLPEGDTQDEYDARLVREAKGCGIAIPEQIAPSSEQRPSHTILRSPSRGSVDSRSSSSSAQTFDLSKSSRAVSLRRKPTQAYHRRGSETSTSAKDYDSVLSNARSSRSANGSPPATASLSSHSLPIRTSNEHGPRKHLIRGLSRLKLRRADSGGSVKK